MINGVRRGTGLPKQKWRRNGGWVAGQRFTATSIESGGGSEREITRSSNERSRETVAKRGAAAGLGPVRRGSFIFLPVVCR